MFSNKREYERSYFENFFETASYDISRGSFTTCEISKINEWKSGLTENTNIKIIAPHAPDKIDSTLFPDYRKDPFDRLVIVQTQRHKPLLARKDTTTYHIEIKQKEDDEEN
jgi:PIN domain nuclease of toxin-antitoxin system